MIFFDNFLALTFNFTMLLEIKYVGKIEGKKNPAHIITAKVCFENKLNHLESISKLPTSLSFY